MRLVTSMIVAAALLPACALMRAPAYEARTVAPAELQHARERVRAFAKSHCGACHTASLPTAVPAALRIYNLDAADWSSTLTAGQLRDGFPRRLSRRLDDAGKGELRTFIEGELALR